MKILVGVDESAAGRRALEWSVRLAARSGAKVEAVRSWTYTPVLLRQLASHEAMDRHTANELRDLVAEVAGPDNEVRKTVLRGPAHHALLRLMGRRRPTLTVVGRRGDDSALGVMGSVSRRLVATSPCPLVVVSHEVKLGPTGGAEPGEAISDGMTVMVGFDGSSHAKRALVWACDLAREAGGRIVLANVIGFGGEADEGLAWHGRLSPALETAAKYVADRGLACETVQTFGDPRIGLEELADECRADVVVIGPRGEGTLTKLVLGTVASYLTEHADRPVAVVPAGWEPTPA